MCGRAVARSRAGLRAVEGAKADGDALNFDGVAVPDVSDRALDSAQACSLDQRGDMFWEAFRSKEGEEASEHDGCDEGAECRTSTAGAC